MDSEDSDSDAGLAFVDTFASAMGAIAAAILVMLLVTVPQPEYRNNRQIEIILEAEGGEQENFELSIDGLFLPPRKAGSKVVEHRLKETVLNSGERKSQSPFSRCDVFDGTSNQAQIWISDATQGEWKINGLVVTSTSNLFESGVPIRLKINVGGELQYERSFVTNELEQFSGCWVIKNFVNKEKPLATLTVGAQQEK